MIWEIYDGGGEVEVKEGKKKKLNLDVAIYVNLFIEQPVAKVKKWNFNFEKKNKRRNALTNVWTLDKIPFCQSACIIEKAFPTPIRFSDFADQNRISWDRAADCLKLPL